MQSILIGLLEKIRSREIEVLKTTSPAIRCKSSPNRNVGIRAFRFYPGYFRSHQFQILFLKTDINNLDLKSAIIKSEILPFVNNLTIKTPIGN
jgi:hypothetical protein